MQNATDLLAEANLLLQNGHFARAYFLSVSCVEEAGKALHAFDAQNRNLSDPAVCTKLIRSLENHALKIIYALGSWALNGSDPGAGLKVAMDLIIDLRHGREPSMYSDIRSNPDRAQTPHEVVRDAAAKDCVRLANDCLANARKHLTEKQPGKFSSAHDRMFTMKSADFQAIMNTDDFWWYLLARMEGGNADLAEAVIRYELDHIKTGMPFKGDAAP